MNTSEPKFRDYGSDDIAAVVAILLSNIPKYFVPAEEQELRDYLAEHPDNYYLIEDAGVVVGAGGIALNSDGTISLCWGMVRNDLIGTGLGKKLALYRIERAEEKWPGRPFFTSTSQHTEGFYEKLGFSTFERISDGFGPGIDTCKMLRKVG